MSYDLKFRKRTLEYLENGHSWKETAAVFGVCQASLGRWTKKKSEGNLAACPAKQRKRKIDSEALKQYVAPNSDAYQAKIVVHFHCSQQIICKALKRNAITRKKRQSVTKNKTVKE